MPSTDLLSSKVSSHQRAMWHACFHLTHQLSPCAYSLNLYAKLNKKTGNTFSIQEIQGTVIPHLKHINEPEPMNGISVT